MKRLLHTVALLAVCVTLVVCIWRDYGLLVTLKRAVAAYLAFFFLTALMLTVYRTGVIAEQQAPPARQEKGRQPDGSAEPGPADA